MKGNRRRFLRNLSLGTAGLTAGIPLFGNPLIRQHDEPDERPLPQSPAGVSGFNMCGYAAPKIDSVRIGFIGLGHRGPGAVDRISHIEGVEIRALCDKLPERVASAQKILVAAGLPSDLTKVLFPVNFAESAKTRTETIKTWQREMKH